MVAGPDRETTAAQGRDRDGLRASHADREEAIDSLKAALVQGRLTGDEFGERVDQAWASRTYAELAEVTADIPAERTQERSPRDPWRATKLAWRMEYAILLPAVFSLLLLKGPHVTEATVIFVPTVVYLLFWILGVSIAITSRPAKRPAGQRPRQSDAVWWDAAPPDASLNRTLVGGTVDDAGGDEQTESSAGSNRVVSPIVPRSG